MKNVIIQGWGEGGKCVYPEFFFYPQLQKVKESHVTDINSEA